MLSRAAEPGPGRQYDVLVIGAGIAGLAAARATAEAGLRTLVLEARDRVGGRIHTLRRGQEVVELGAEFIHGRAPEIWDLIAEAGLATYERTGEFLRRDGAALVPVDHDEDGALESLEAYVGPDYSFADYIARLPLSEDAKRQVTSYVEGFNAADACEASILALGRQQRAEDAINGERSWRITGGYDLLPAYLREKLVEEGGTLLLRNPVAAVHWSAGREGTPAQVHGVDGSVFHVGKVIVTLPLGVLQARAVRFHPEPSELLLAADSMRMGKVLRATLAFRRRLWPSRLSFLLAGGAPPNVWWSAHPVESLTLTGWIGGPRSQQLAGLSSAALQTHFADALAEALALPASEIEAELESFHTHDWSADKFARGAYSWVPVGAIDASARMSHPVGGTLFFAGEHTDTTGHWGTVHAALRSGLRAAAQVLAS